MNEPLALIALFSQALKGIKIKGMSVIVSVHLTKNKNVYKKFKQVALNLLY